MRWWDMGWMMMFADVCRRYIHYQAKMHNNNNVSPQTIVLFYCYNGMVYFAIIVQKYQLIPSKSGRVRNSLGFHEFLHI